MGTRMQVGIRLHDVAPGTIEERAAIAHEQGFTCAHIALSKLVKDYSVDDSALTPGYATYLRHVFEKNMLDIAVLGNYLNLATPDKEELRRAQERYKAHLRFASLLGCSVVGTETGAPNTEYRFEPACRSEEALDLFIDNLYPVVEWAEKCGVILAIEPVTKHIVYNAKRARRVLDTIDSPNLQIIFDPVNLLDESNYRDHRQIIKDAIDTIGRDVAIVHVKDLIIVGGQAISVAAGQGIIDYSDLIEFIEKDKPYIQCTLENTNPENAVAARLFFEGGAVREV